MTSEAPVAIVTAAGRGIGAAIARELATKGWRLVLLSRHGGAEALAKELGQAGISGSVTEADDLEKLVRLTLDSFGRIDGVVVNTGHPPKGDLLEIPDSDWLKAAEMMILSLTRLARLAIPTMEAQGGGAFVNISGLAAIEPELGFPTSSVFRAGLSALTKLYADRYAASGIRMNNILPGHIDSLPETPEKLARIPMRRMGRVQEIAKVTAFLLSPDASYITGQNIRVDGGRSRSI